MGFSDINLNQMRNFTGAAVLMVAAEAFSGCSQTPSNTLSTTAFSPRESVQLDTMRAIRDQCHERERGLLYLFTTLAGLVGTGVGFGGGYFVARNRHKGK